MGAGACPYLFDPISCREQRRARFAAARPEIRAWETNPCENCKAGRENETKTAEKRKEDQLEDLKKKLLEAVRQRKQVYRREVTAKFEVSAADVNEVAACLEKEGSIRITRTKGGGAIYTPPGAPDPRGANRPAPAPRTPRKARGPAHADVVQNLEKAAARTRTADAPVAASADDPPSTPSGAGKEPQKNGGGEKGRSAIFRRFASCRRGMRRLRRRWFMRIRRGSINCSRRSRTSPWTGGVCGG